MNINQLPLSVMIPARCSSPGFSTTNDPILFLAICNIKVIIVQCMLISIKEGSFRTTEMLLRLHF